MGLFDQWRGASPQKQQRELEDASQAISSIFSPQQVPHPASLSEANVSRSHCRDTGTTKNNVLPLASLNIITPDDDNAKTPRRKHTWWRVGLFAPKSAVNNSPALSSSSTTSTVPGASISASRWEDLPPCPISGYALTRKGLVDQLAQPQAHLLSIRELRALIVELAGVEQRAKYTVDTQFASTIGSRGHHGLELFINPCLFLTGVYLMTWKTAKLYREAVPRQSVLLTRCFELLRWSVPAREQERIAQRHRRLMRATNARVTLSFLTGAFVLGVAVWTRPRMDVMDTAPEVVQAKQSVAYQQHTERSLKWLWFVYYHHPSYAKEARRLESPALPELASSEHT